MFKRSPYYGWLLLALMGWGIIAFSFYARKYQLRQAQIAETVSEDLVGRGKALDELLQNHDLISRMYSGKLTNEEIKDLEEQPFQIYAFEKDVLIFWNNNTVIGYCGADSLRTDHNTLFDNNGIYLRKCFNLPFLETNKTIVALLPVVYRYPFENEYLHSHFAAGDHIPMTTVVSLTPDEESKPVTNEAGQPIFYLHFTEKITCNFLPGSKTIWGIIAALFITFTWLNLIAVDLSRRKGARFAMLFGVSMVVVFRAITYLLGYPFHLDLLQLFSPKLYASTWFLKSLGDLILNLICLLWLLVISLQLFPKYRVLTSHPSRNTRIALITIVLALLACCAVLPVMLIRSLVLDSAIPFDVSHFYTITPETIAGLFTIILLAACTCLFIFFLYVQYRFLLRNVVLRYALLAGAVAIGILLTGAALSVDRVVGLCWFTLFMVLLDLPYVKKPKKLFAPDMIFWGAFITVFCTIGVLHYYEIKEERQRKAFAERVANQRDDVMEFLFQDIGKRIADDKWLAYYVDSPSADSRTLIDEHLSSAYLSGQLNRYDSRIYLFTEEGRPLFNSDTTSLPTLLRTASNAFPINAYLFYRESVADRRHYLAHIPIMEDTATVGHVFLDIALKNSGNESVYPELLQPGNIKTLQQEELKYGIYSNGQLIGQSSGYPFPIQVSQDSVTADDIQFDQEEDNRVSIYRLDYKKVVAVIHAHEEGIETITLFSYLLGLFILFALLALLLRLLFAYLTRLSKNERIINLTLRKRIHFAMLGLVLLSFIIIGCVTIWFFINQYDSTNRTKLQTAMQTVERSMQQYMRSHDVAADAYSFRAETDSARFKNFINNLAANELVDINVYDSYGTLKVTSQEDIYNKFILARIMMPDAYYRLSKKGSSTLIQEEKVGELNYLSSYIPLRETGGQIFGYINIPFFSSQKELNYQISNVVVALINLYAFIFLLSSLLTVFITGWLTRTLQVIISKFERFNLHQNELLEWPYDDEIGLLVREYNKMVQKVEEQAAQLSKSEREGAWREMARQVAHEIKNPLTPMKLNIQYLQQALKNDHPNTRQLTEHVANSMIEQIDNLSHIASAFSDFAKMPEAQPEEIELNDLLERSSELYLNNTNVAVHFHPSGDDLIVYADRSQLLRVVTNLVQNAVEAIPEERDGRITISLHREYENVLIKIEDNGSGIPLEIVDRIFSPYFTTKGSGTGLGLAMTRRIIEFWKGRIWFETTHDVGTTFFITLPLV